MSLLSYTSLFSPCNISTISPTMSANFILKACLLAIKIISNPLTGRIKEAARKLERSLLLILFRLTALPIFLVTMYPRRSKLVDASPCDGVLAITIKALLAKNLFFDSLRREKSAFCLRVVILTGTGFLGTKTFAAF